MNSCFYHVLTVSFLCYLREHSNLCLASTRSMFAMLWAFFFSSVAIDLNCNVNRIPMLHFNDAYFFSITVLQKLCSKKLPNDNSDGFLKPTTWTKYTRRSNICDCFQQSLLESSHRRLRDLCLVLIVMVILVKQIILIYITVYKYKTMHRL